MVPSSPEDLLLRLRGLSAEDGGLCPGEGLVVALSGGADSVALLDLLVRLREQLKLRLVAAHLDHGLRDDSAEDARFCQQLCEGLGVDFHGRRLDVAALATETGLGLEAAGRQARYSFFEELLVEADLDRVATGHHLDDHAETLLMWLFRGTGLSGMRGIAASTEDRVRPLRSFRRQEIRDYLSQRGLEFREDSSNADPSFTRNRIRGELLPLLGEIFDEGAAGRLIDFARRAEGDLSTLESLAETALETCQIERGEEEWILDRGHWLQQDKALQFHLLRRIVGSREEAGPQRWDEANYLSLLDFAANGETGKRHPLPGGGWLVIDRARLRFTLAGKKQPQPARTSLATELRMRRELLPVSGDMVTIPTEFTAYFDADCVYEPLRLRPFEPGDRMQAFGMEGRKKLTEIYRESGIPWDRRASMLVLEDARSIIWAVGITTSESTRISKRSQRVLKVTLEPRA